MSVSITSRSSSTYTPPTPQISTSSGGFSTTSGTYVDVTNLTVTITVTGRPVEVSLIDDGTGSVCYFGGANGATGMGYFNARLVDSGAVTTYFETNVLAGSTATPASSTDFFPPGALSTRLTQLTAGTYSLKLQINNNGVAGNTAFVNNCRLYLKEV